MYIFGKTHIYDAIACVNLRNESLSGIAIFELRAVECVLLVTAMYMYTNMYMYVQCTRARTWKTCGMMLL